jgi:hypothetical protein
VVNVVETSEFASHSVVFTRLSMLSASDVLGLCKYN